MRLARTATVAVMGLTLASTAFAAIEKKAPTKSAATKTVAKPKPTNGDVTRAQMLAQVKKTFDLADTNHDGFMSRAEFAKRMSAVVNREAPPTKADAQRMLDAANRAFNDVDANHDGKLSLAEASKRPLAAFDMMDTNHDGVLTVAEKAAAHQNAPSLPNGPTSDGPTQGEMQGPNR
jgi:Ca2+-binding EF-hand superfamily protein